MPPPREEAADFFFFFFSYLFFLGDGETLAITSISLRHGFEYPQPSRLVFFFFFIIMSRTGKLPSPSFYRHIPLSSAYRHIRLSIFIPPYPSLHLYTAISLSPLHTVISLSPLHTVIPPPSLYRHIPPLFCISPSPLSAYRYSPSFIGKPPATAITESIRKKE